ncbi:MAG: c-type cytochrome [Burkholderiaceae bacterium]
MKSDFLASGRQAALRLTGLALVAISMSAGPVFAAEPAKGEVVKIEPAKGGKIAQEVCVACHGADGNSALPVNPILAGQHEATWPSSCTNSGRRVTSPRPETIMAGFAAQLSEGGYPQPGRLLRRAADQACRCQGQGSQ